MGNLQTRTKYKIVGADYSAQEPRLAAFYSQDKAMVEAYQEGKDLYAVIASMSFGRKYEDCLEFYPEGTELNIDGQIVVCGHKTHTNKEGKNYRAQAKRILLGIMYGRGAASVGEQIGKTKEEAQQIIDTFFNTFPAMKNWVDNSMNTAYTNGYVSGLVNRRRRLPDIQLPKYSITSKSSDFNPLLKTKGAFTNGNVELLEKYKVKMSQIKYRKQAEAIIAEAATENIAIIDNGSKIAQAERQTVNAIVQGGAATLTKTALIGLYKDHRIKDIGAKLVNSVHDEILMEVPEVNSVRCEELLSEIMVSSATKFVYNVPMSSDTYNVTHWYEENICTELRSSIKKLTDEGYSEDDAKQKVLESRSELTPEQFSFILQSY